MRRQLVPLALLSLAAACGDGGPTGPAGPVPGVLKIALTTPNADDGALLFTVSGGRISTVDAAAAGYQIYTAQPDTLTTRILVTGDIGAGEVVRIHVPDTRSACSPAMRSRWLRSGRCASFVAVRAGAVAQLGEHLLCKQGVTGSIPVRSIRTSGSNRSAYLIRPHDIT